jgi:glycosyltransferase involved in cell wall biosynthesis
MRLLYISSWHTTQEFDDLTIFTELGIDWFSTGIYLNPEDPVPYGNKILRTTINKKIDPSLLEEFLKLNPKRYFFCPPNITKHFIQNFDVIFCNFSYMYPNVIELLTKCVDNYSPIIYRTYGHQSEEIELKLQELRKIYKILLIRNSPTESSIKSYSGHDAIIRGYVDENIYNNWKCTIQSSLTFANDFNARIYHKNYSNYRVFLKDIKPFIQNNLYGHGNGIVKSNNPVLWNEQLQLYKSHAVYFSLNSPPANFPYSFIEALMTGIPIVTIGTELGNAPGRNSYEASSLITNGVNGFYSDKPDELKVMVTTLILDQNLGKKIGEEGRKLALTYFSKEKIKNQWFDFFKLVN